MPVIRKYFPNKQLVFIKGYGDIIYAESLNTFEYLANRIDAFELVDILIDHSEVKSIPNMVEAFNLGSIIGQKFRQLNFAVIYPQIFRESYIMFKNAGNNRGTNIEIFEHKSDALNWIINSRECIQNKAASVLNGILEGHRL